MKSKHVPSLRTTSLINSSSEKRKESKGGSQELFFENSKWLSSNDAAIYLGISSVESFRNLVSRYKIPKYRLFGRLRFNVEELDNLILPST